MNQTNEVITYEIRGGQVGMILSTCDLSPGEVETWDLPAPLRQIEVPCALRVWCGEDEIDRPVHAASEVWIEHDDVRRLAIREV